MLELNKLDQENEIKLKRKHKIRQEMLEKRKSFEYRHKEKTYRREKKAKNKKNKKSKKSGLFHGRKNMKNP